MNDVMEQLPTIDEREMRIAKGYALLEFQEATDEADQVAGATARLEVGLDRLRWAIGKQSSMEEIDLLVEPLADLLPVHTIRAALNTLYQRRLHAKQRLDAAGRTRYDVCGIKVPDQWI